MTPEESVRAMADRLGAIDWERHGHRCWSKSVLLKEYFRRAAQWAAAYRCDSPVPFFDIALCVDSRVRIDQHVLDGVIEKIAAGRGGLNVKQVTPFILRWAALRATPGIDLPTHLEDPFEPLILLFERDGGFHTENGEVDLEYRSVPMRGWRKRADSPPMPSFAPDALDEIDRAGSLAQFGYIMGPDGEPVGATS
ncbi:hypothetical protein FHR83_004010 [Actinoplanes campanulatus]|uniref:Uncharacterized protein n=1 Tax=Actinoplanes campanulatus TaxID=113559 RepID=A0A7W5FFF9_9ACTN|nr:hypothetical protein [Actinoplanes campanulatus]MBB3096340.1 hypothetical protein [Actinoplanes campanulatus]GGN18910.1 hypothetical protein GCM10010109_32290 [Actinoplanes campanulatus]GID42598.1 hypothetical protein Aca09nite_91040 [Actinoplanes campanulatus]